MKKRLLLLVVFLLMFTIVGCSEEKEPNKPDDPVVEESEIPVDDIEFISINLEDLYFVGEESDISISIYPERKINSISYKSNDEEIITIDNNGHLKALKEGTVLITITIDGKEEKRIVEVEEDEIFSALNENVDHTTSQEWYEEHLRYLAREEEAKEKGFSSYREYREYLSELARQENIKKAIEQYEEECRIAESLGLSWEDYRCLQTFKVTFDELNEMKNIAGRILEIRYYDDLPPQLWERVLENDKNNVFDIKVSYLTFKLGSFLNSYSISNETHGFVAKPGVIPYGEYYHRVLLYNNWGFDVDEEAMKKINDTLPGADEYIGIYNYLKNEVNQRMARLYVLYLIDPENTGKVNGTPIYVLYAKEFEEIDKIMENYEK